MCGQNPFSTFSVKMHQWRTTYRLLHPTWPEIFSSIKKTHDFSTCVCNKKARMSHCVNDTNFSTQESHSTWYNISIQ